jgi:hypothetical protein
MTKKKFAIKIANLINDAGVTCRRDDKQVLNKISHIQKSFREMHDWAYNTTGQGLKEEDEDKWEATIRRRCPHFYDLLPIMGERASASPVIDSEKGIDATDDSSDSLSDSASQSTYVPKDPPIAGKKLAKDVLQVGDIITYMATTTDQEGYIQTKKKTTQITRIDGDKMAEEDDDEGSFFPLVLLDNAYLGVDTLVSRSYRDGGFFLTWMLLLFQQVCRAK